MIIDVRLLNSIYITNRIATLSSLYRSVDWIENIWDKLFNGSIAFHCLLVKGVQP